eukprot:scaffold10121_cov112-Isochrysis_galbana.AAC.6
MFDYLFFDFSRNSNLSWSSAAAAAPADAGDPSAMADDYLADWDMGSGPSCSDAASSDECPPQCWWCVDSSLCADDWTTCQHIGLSDGGSGLSMTMSITAFLLCAAAAALFCSRGWGGSRNAEAASAVDDDEEDRPRYIEGGSACHDLGASSGGGGPYAACGEMVRSIELGACGGGAGSWAAETFSARGDDSNRNGLPEGQRLLSWG